MLRYLQIIHKYNIAQINQKKLKILLEGPRTMSFRRQHEYMKKSNFKILIKTYLDSKFYVDFESFFRIKIG